MWSQLEYNCNHIDAQGRLGTMEVGVRALKAHLSAHLARVKSGETVTVTERGRPVARLVPVEHAAVPPDLAALMAAGRVTWSGQRLRPLTPLPLAPGEKTVAQMVSEDRR
jgi:prevent-host-death family protein